MAKWDTHNGRRWVVVACWHGETTVTFHRDEQEMVEAYDRVVALGADAFCATPKYMKRQGDRG